MRDLTILTVTTDDDFLTVFQQHLHRQVAAASRMFVVGTIDEACVLSKTACPRLIVVHWTRDSGRYEQLDRLLWTTTAQARRIPVLVIAERYRTDQATMMYRMGVAEYISRTHHLDQLGSVFLPYLPVPTMCQSGASSEPVGPLGNAWSPTPKPEKLTTQAV